MSYCRWSSDDYQCDFYVWADVHGGWRTEVSRLMDDETNWEWLDLPEPTGGNSYWHDTASETAENLERLRAEGFASFRPSPPPTRPRARSEALGEVSERIAAGRVKHGVGASEDFPGNVCHLVSPIVGILRLRKRDGGTVPDLGWIIDRLSLVLDMAEQEAETRVAPAAVEAIVTARLASIAALHRDDGEGWCYSCGYSWPCETGRALAGATQVGDEAAGGGV